MPMHVYTVHFSYSVSIEIGTKHSQYQDIAMSCITINMYISRVCKYIELDECVASIYVLLHGIIGPEYCNVWSVCGVE